MMYLPVEQWHSRAESLVAIFKQGGTSCIDEAIDLDRVALELCPLDHPMRPVSLICLAIHLGSSNEKHSTFARKVTLIGRAL